MFSPLIVLNDGFQGLKLYQQGQENSSYSSGRTVKSCKFYGSGGVSRQKQFPKSEIALLSTEAESSAISNLINHRSGL